MAPRLRSRRRLYVACLVLSATGILLVGIERRLRINTSYSAPPGLYALADRELTYDTWVVACLPEPTARHGLDRDYLPPGSCPGRARPILKRVAALPGDRVTVTPGELVTDRLRLPRLEQDSKGRPIRKIAPGTYAVAPGTVWLYSDYSPRSWDSRYWGPLPIQGLQTAVPIWVFP